MLKKNTVEAYLFSITIYDDNIILSSRWQCNIVIGILNLLLNPNILIAILHASHYLFLECVSLLWVWGSISFLNMRARFTNKNLHCDVLEVLRYDFGPHSCWAKPVFWTNPEHRTQLLLKRKLKWNVYAAKWRMELRVLFGVGQPQKQTFEHLSLYCIANKFIRPRWQYYIVIDSMTILHCHRCIRISMTILYCHRKRYGWRILIRNLIELRSDTVSARNFFSSEVKGTYRGSENIEFYGDIRLLQPGKHLRTRDHLSQTRWVRFSPHLVLFPLSIRSKRKISKGLVIVLLNLHCKFRIRQGIILVGRKYSEQMGLWLTSGSSPGSRHPPVEEQSLTGSFVGNSPTPRFWSALFWLIFGNLPLPGPEMIWNSQNNIQQSPTNNDPEGRETISLEGSPWKPPTASAKSNLSCVEDTSSLSCSWLSRLALIPQLVKRRVTQVIDWTEWEMKLKNMFKPLPNSLTVKTCEHYFGWWNASPLALSVLSAQGGALSARDCGLVRWRWSRGRARGSRRSAILNSMFGEGLNWILSFVVISIITNYCQFTNTRSTSKFKSERNVLRLLWVNWRRTKSSFTFSVISLKFTLGFRFPFILQNYIHHFILAG